jgi:hypothetical protein
MASFVEPVGPNIRNQIKSLQKTSKACFCPVVSLRCHQLCEESNPARQNNPKTKSKNKNKSSNINKHKTLSSAPNKCFPISNQNKKTPINTKLFERV